VPWLDLPGADQVTVRLSRATGLPDALPDIYGLALRIPVADYVHADLLLATTGTGPLTRFVLRPTRQAQSAYSCLLPYRAPCGPVVLAARPVGADSRGWALACATLTGPWAPFAELRLEPMSNSARDAPVTFDPVLHPVPALDNYAWVAHLRRFAYAGSRRARGEAVQPDQVISQR
jgi:hypothetical protein